mmetsp:Transcript_44799/g.115943  ORF Transcript_44799/g.115943 Transcript_44799/m.115943 type:complete len:234 (-) Transcript_44799:30-731(-)
MARQKSARSECRWAALIACSGSCSPKGTRNSRRAPPHSPQCRPVMWFMPLFGPTRKFRRYSLPHCVQASKERLPCSSAILSAGMPERRCMPSTFCEMQYLMMPSSMSFWMARCVKVGSALSISSRSSLGAFGPPLSSCAFLSQTPAPVGNTVLTPDRKSGIPADVEIPAPVKMMACLALRRLSAMRFTFASSSRSESKCSRLSSSVASADQDMAAQPSVEGDRKPRCPLLDWV